LVRQAVEEALLRHGRSLPGNDTVQIMKRYEISGWMEF
jgi:hypothetical protein